MDVIPHSRKRRNRARLAAFAATVLLGPWNWAAALADMIPLPPQTNIRVTIVQWMSAKGQYERWDALGGDFQISDGGTLALPLIGTIPVGKLDAAGLSAEIAARLKARIGLVETPEATVTVVGYPPFYVVGDVKAPGEYKYHAGLTVLQSLAMGGGEFRPDDKNSSALDKTGYVGMLRGLDNSIMRSEIRIARLQAEMSGASQINFDTRSEQDSAAAAAVYRQEKAIFAARANLLKRQSKSYSELRDLLYAEIDNLEKKSEGANADISSVEKELRNVKSMVEKGIALPSKQADLERMLRSYYAGRLDLATAVMRARQGIAEASRNLEGLYDKQHTEVVSELQTEQANLDQIKLKRETAQKQFLDMLAQGLDPETPAENVALTFKINRRVNGNVEEIAASEDTLLQPGDVVRVTRKLPEMNVSPSGETTPSAADTQSRISQ